jgi:hypothetical protein
MKKVFFAALFTMGFSGMANAQDAPPPPCGPKGNLPASLSTNVATDSRCFEIRMYTANTMRNGGGDYALAIDELHQRFREEEVAIFEKHGAEIIAVWQRLDDPETLVWMLAYRDRAHRTEVWNKFREDPAWDTLLEKYPVGVSAEVYMMSATDYSKLK